MSADPIFRRAGAAAAGLLLAACAHVTPEQKSFLEKESALLGNKPTTLVADGCVIRDEVGSDYVLHKASKDAGEAAAAATAGYLQSRGFQVQHVATPFICASLQEPLPPDLGVAESKDAPVSSSVKLPIALGTSRPDAYVALFRAVHRETPAEPAKAQIPSRQPLGLSDEHVAQLRTELGNGTLWVLRAGGAQVSFGKSFGVGMMTGLLTVAAFGVGTTSTPVDGVTYDVALVELDSREIVWNKTVAPAPADPADPKTFSHDWAARVMEPFVSVPDSAPKRAITSRQASRRSTRAAAPPTDSADSAAPVQAPGATAGGSPSLVAAAVATPGDAKSPEPVPAAPPAAPEVLPRDARVAIAGALLAQPQPSGRTMAKLEAGAVIRLVSKTDNGGKVWYYVQAGPEAGWLPATHVVPDRTDGTGPLPAKAGIGPG